MFINVSVGKYSFDVDRFAHIGENEFLIPFVSLS